MILKYLGNRCEAKGCVSVFQVKDNKYYHKINNEKSLN